MQKSILETVEGLNGIIRSLQKIESKQRMGHFIDSHRAINALIAEFEKNKKDIIESEKQEQKNV